MIFYNANHYIGNNSDVNIIVYFYVMFTAFQFFPTVLKCNIIVNLFKSL